MSSQSTQMKSLVFDLLKKDTSSELFDLVDVSPSRTWEYELPTLCTDKRFTPRQPWTSSSSFERALFEQYGMLGKIGWNNLALGGSAVPLLLLNSDRRPYDDPSDLDFYIYGVGRDEAALVARGKEFIQDILNWVEDAHASDLQQYMNKKNKHKDEYVTLAQARHIIEKDFKSIPQGFSSRNRVDLVTANRRGNVITISGIPGFSTSIDLNLTPYETMSELLASIGDLGVNAAAFAEKRLFFNKASKFCLENVCVLTNNRVADKRYGARLEKYYRHGFDIIAPCLDVANIPTRNIKFGLPEAFELNGIVVVYNSVSENKHRIFTTTLRVTEFVGEESTSPSADMQTDEETSGPRDEFGYTSVPNRVSGDVGYVYHNLEELVRGTRRFVMFGSGVATLDIFSCAPKITRRMIENCYRTLEGRVLDKGSQTISTLSQYYTCRKLSELVRALYLDYIVEEVSRLQGGSIRGISDAQLEAWREKDKKFMCKVTEEQVEVARTALATLESDISAGEVKLNILVDVLFPKAGVSPKGWYKEYYNAEWELV